ncbi:MAG: hypothetical protein ACRC6X_01120 [Culicoidibacterales bacterium]
MEKQKWSSTKKKYLVLSIMLTVQMIPMLGFALNMLFVYSIIGIVYAIMILLASKKERVTRGGAILGLITFLMAIPSGLYGLAMVRYEFYSSMWMWMWFFVNWFVCIGAVTTSYYSTYAKPKVSIKMPLKPVEYVPHELKTSASLPKEEPQVDVELYISAQMLEEEHKTDEKEYVDAQMLE